ncbi:MAG: DUF1002 domain-containing protein [Eubacterium sp.]|nr:DUF1002 domain-containing protein [Eubacterium sp.]
MKRNKFICTHRKWTALLLAMLMITALFAMPVSASAAVEEGQTFVSFGEDLSPEGRAEVLRLFGMTEADLDNCTVMSVSSQEEHEMFDSYLPQDVIGNVSKSSSMITTREEGHGIQVRTENITWCTVSMYQNALATAGIKDADVVIASPGGATGSSALLGVTKAYSEITGESLKAESLDAAAEELILTGEVGDEIGDQDKAAQLIASVKEAVASKSLDAEEIEQVIDEAAEQLDIDPSTINKEDISGLMEKIDDLDLDSKSLREQAGEVYDKLKENGVDLGISKEEALNWFQKIIKWFRDMWSRYVG